MCVYKRLMVMVDHAFQPAEEKKQKEEEKGKDALSGKACGLEVFMAVSCFHVKTAQEIFKD